ncbi:putative isomerase YbhE [Daldinia caldariorum]|uniref:putative isomerase YbhE n=1 Tax=Daldinia caldariorum TaxID=326644 RepID=UPI002007900F|nr:putative isomerase YbhE [Daldinia caldariorum]KAI1470325.1 putative isomerase YbhE [Daldinia caldariorum]
MMTSGGQIARARGVGLITTAAGVTFLFAFFIFAHQLIRSSQSIDELKHPTMWKGISPAGLLSLGLAGQTSATLLYVSSYAGAVTTLRLTLPGDGSATTAATLENISKSTGCGPNPSWLTLDYSKNFLFCLDEGFNGPYGGVTTFFTGDDGTLATLDKLDVIQGPVSIAEFGVGGSGFAIAHYSGSSVSVVGFNAEGNLTLLHNETYTLAGPGPNPERQEAPHPHEAILDPTASYVLVPDLGADLVRIYQADASTLGLTPIAPLALRPGSGPRHGAFKVTADKTYFYLVSELGNTITGYEITYNDNKTLSFDELFSIPTHGEERKLPEKTGAAEILVSPDGNFLIVSSRWEDSFNITNFDPTNSTEIPSDPLITYSIDHTTGKLTKVQEFAAGGRVPRHFSINADGNLVAVALQGDGRVVVLDRDVKTGLFKDYIAYADIEGEVTAAIFREDYHTI